MRAVSVTAIVTAASVLAGCGGCDQVITPDAGNTNTFDQCDGDPPSFVREAFLSLLGHRPRSQAEVDVYVDLYAAAKALGDDPAVVVARTMMNRPEFADRWVDMAMDALHVQRLDTQTEAACWDLGTRLTVTPSLALAIRDQLATAGGDGRPFTMLDLANSAIALDDLTPIYRGQLFSLVGHPIPAANVGRVDAELARRADFGGTFDASYLHRDIVCLGCHNSEGSVTDSDDPALDRHHPVPGNPERAVYGMATGVAIERAHAAFRVDSFVAEGNTRPWGWEPQCGQFAAPAQVPVDVADIDAKLASVSGKRATVYDLEAALARGFAALRASGPPTGDLSDPDAALAWLVTLKITEDVWTKATGTKLTIANYFPRNQAASDLLYTLASRFVSSGFSLKALLVEVVTSDYFNRQPAERGCGASPYNYPNVFDPWVTAEADEARRANGPGDAIAALDARTLLTATNLALEWGPPPHATRFPDYGEPGCENESCTSATQACQVGFCCETSRACKDGGLLPRDELPFLRGIGVFLRNSERGFRGLDFQGQLAWEQRNGACSRPPWVDRDLIDKLVAAGGTDPAATAGDLVIALKDRLTGEPAIGEGAEADAIGALLGGSLADPASTVTTDELRRVCGAIISSPQFLLQGMAGRGGERPLLTPADASYDAVCADLATRNIGIAERSVACSSGKLELVTALAPHRATREAPGGVVRLPIRRGKPPARTPAPLH